MERNDEFKSIINRIKRARGVTLRKIADELGMNYSHLSDVSNGHAPFTDTTRIKLINTFGRDLVYPDETPAPSKTYGGDGADVPMVTLPLIPLDCVAGFPLLDNHGVTLADCEQYAVPEFTARGADYLIRVAGSSMYPRYSNGDILACKRVESLTFFQWGMIYVIDTQQGILVKRIFECTDDKNSIICRSENETDFPPFRLPKNEIRSVSIVVGQISVS